MKNSAFCIINIPFYVTYRDVSILYKWQRDEEVLCLLKTCKIRPNILRCSSGTWYRICILKVNRTCASFFYLYNIDIFQFSTQKRTFTYMYQTKYVLRHQSRTNTNVYIGIGRIYMFISHLSSTAFNKACIAQFVDHQTSDRSALGTSPTLDKNFSFCICRSRRAPGWSTGPIQMKSSMTFIRCI